MKAFVVLILGLVAISAFGKEEFDRVATKQLFERMQNTELGKDMFASIQLELSSNLSQNVVDRLLQMLNELLDSQVTQKDEAISQLGTKQGVCASKVSDLEYEIEELKEKIQRAGQELPNYEEQLNGKQTQIVEKKSEVNNHQDDIRALDEKNDAAKIAYQQSVDEHNNMIAALKEAKEIISQLSASTFLQKKKAVNNSFAQMTESLNKTSSKLTKSHQKGMIDALLALVQNPGVQADQEKVAQVITIIDELIEYEQQTMDIERQAEAKRLARYDFDRTRLDETAQFLDAAIKDLTADASTLKTKVIELTNDLSIWQQSIADKEEQIRLENIQCGDVITQLEKSIVEYNENMDIIRQVIVIFRSQSVQDVKSVVDGI